MSDPSKNVSVKRRTKDQGTREKGVKHRTTDAPRPAPGKDADAKQSPSCSLEEIANIFNKGVEELSSSVPSSAEKTPTSIPDVPRIGFGSSDRIIHVRSIREGK